MIIQAKKYDQHRCGADACPSLKGLATPTLTVFLSKSYVHRIWFRLNIEIPYLPVW